jgi:hypothetical protein
MYIKNRYTVYTQKDMRMGRRFTLIIMLVVVFFLIFNIWVAINDAQENLGQMVKIIISPVLGFAFGWIFLQATFALDRAIQRASLPKMWVWMKSRSALSPFFGLMIGFILIAALRNQGWYKNTFYNATSPIGAAGFLLAMLTVAYIRYGKMLRAISAK